MLHGTRGYAQVMDEIKEQSLSSLVELQDKVRCRHSNFQICYKGKRVFPVQAVRVPLSRLKINCISKDNKYLDEHKTTGLR